MLPTHDHRLSGVVLAPAVGRASIAGPGERIVNRLPAYGMDGARYTVLKIEVLKFGELGNGALIPLPGPERFELESGEELTEIRVGVLRVGGSATVIRIADAA